MIIIKKIIKQLQQNILFFLFLISFVLNTQPSSAIQNGTETDKFEHVGYIDQGGFAGTATLISPEWALTAAHVVTDYEAGDSFVCDIGSSLISNAYLFSTDTELWYSTLDIALVNLATPIDYSWYPSLNPTTFNHDDYVGAEMLVVGFGANDYWGLEGSGIKRYNTEELVPTHDYDGTNFMPDGTPYDIQGGNNIYLHHGVTQYGDSGGPMFMDYSDNWVLTGVVSRTTAWATTPGDGDDLFPDVSLAKDWIENTASGDFNWSMIGYDYLETNTTVPIPSSIFLLGTGIVSLLGVRRRIKQ